MNEKRKTKRPLYRELAQLCQARLNCIKSGNGEWQGRHTERLVRLADDHLPSGSGFDSGTKIDLDKSSGEKLVLYTAFHHMTEGMYDGWTEHTITVSPSLVHGFTVSVSGRDREQIKEYIAERFCLALSEEIEIS